MIAAIREPGPSPGGDPGDDLPATAAHGPGSAPSGVARGPSMPEGPGSTIGPYRLLSKLGEGGMGSVFLAEQDRPIRREVALQVVKPGMDTGQVLARFEAERQALAPMDHPHIARVLDVGATATGRPFFVMELVRGVPITDYCDRERLTIRQRLALFLPVCRAIQNAHQKGIIHRDIKPSNVLVTLRDGVPEPKVIDFGVAKAIDRRLTERTMVTECGALVGTLESMSPEQAGSQAPDVDTRSDIYTLGVLLDELLTGTTPLRRNQLRLVAHPEILRRLREEDSHRPSQRVAESPEGLAAIAAGRRIDPARLARSIRGELDWIAMKALEKDRSRRSETANGLARDVRRHLDGDAVEAGPPSARSRLGKFARKHRAALAGAAAGAGLLGATTVVSGGAAVWAGRQLAEQAARDPGVARLDRIGPVDRVGKGGRLGEPGGRPHPEPPNPHARTSQPCRSHPIRPPRSTGRSSWRRWSSGSTSATGSRSSTGRRAPAGTPRRSPTAWGVPAG